MSRIWIGDFRCKALQHLISQVESEYAYIIEDNADYSWFGTNATYQLEKLSPTKASIIIMTGFNDCVNCCLYNLKIEHIVKSYENYIDWLSQFEKWIKFYF